MPSLPSSSEPSSGKTVPLVIYNSDGTSTKIGDATVTESGIGWVVNATITDDLAKELGYEQGPFSIGYNTIDQEVTDVAVVPPPDIMRPRYR